MTSIIWFRNDLRLWDNPALYQAAKSGEVLPVYILPEGLGAASRWWLHYSLQSLRQDLSKMGIELILRSGNPAEVLTELCDQTSCKTVFWNKLYTHDQIEIEQQVIQQLQVKSIACQVLNGQYLIQPENIKNKQGLPFRVFTPFWKQCLTSLQVEPLLEIPKIDKTEVSIQSENLDDWNLLPTKPDWAAGMRESWFSEQQGVSEQGAQTLWKKFVEQGLSKYEEGRNFPSILATSRLSPYLAFGQISIRQLWHEANQLSNHPDIGAKNVSRFISELGWREFGIYLFHYFPYIAEQPFNKSFENFPWNDDESKLIAWQQGQTGYPIVDAGMRELWHTGYMHNRVRMVVASFLTKHLRIHWKHGAEWFWDTLVDADMANNTASWQWVAGSGADAAPYFRIFNPTTQGEKFDKDGEYIRRWVPELSNLPNSHIHQPWELGQIELLAMDVKLGEDYPYPIVDHKQARQAALDAYQECRNG